MNGKANHSLQATGATAMFKANVPEKMIRGVTGHQSNALSLYERPTLEQQQCVSCILMQGRESFVPDSKHVKCVEPAASKARDGGADLIGSLFFP